MGPKEMTAYIQAGRPNQCPEGLWETAVHEAWHVVVAHMLRVRYGSVSVAASKSRPNVLGEVRVLRTGGLTGQSKHGSRRVAVRHMAVFAAPQVLEHTRADFAVPDDWNSWITSRGFSSDLMQLEDLKQFFPEGRREAALGVAYELAAFAVRAGVVAIRAVAVAVVEAPKRRLTAAEVRAAIRGSGVRWHGPANAPMRRWVWAALRGFDFRMEA